MWGRLFVYVQRFSEAFGLGWVGGLDIYPSSVSVMHYSLSISSSFILALALNLSFPISLHPLSVPHLPAHKPLRPIKTTS